jgi:hypothetical protein
MDNSIAGSFSKHFPAQVTLNYKSKEVSDTIKNTETLIDASNEVGLEMNVEKTKHMLLSHHQNVG